MGSVFSTADKKIFILTFTKQHIHNENRRVLPCCRVNDPGRSHTSERGKPSGNKKIMATPTPGSSPATRPSTPRPSEPPPGWPVNTSSTGDQPLQEWQQEQGNQQQDIWRQHWQL